MQHINICSNLQYVFILYLLYGGLYNPIDITVMFSQSVYSANENAGLVKPILVLSNSSSTDIIIKVKDTENRATSE